VLTGLISGTGPGTNLGRGVNLILGQANAGIYALGSISWALGCHQAV